MARWRQKFTRPIVAPIAVTEAMVARPSLVR